MNIIFKNQDMYRNLTRELLDGYIVHNIPVIVLRDQNHYDLLEGNINKLVDRAIINLEEQIHIDKIKHIIKTLVASHDFPITEVEEYDEIRDIYNNLFPDERI